MGKIKGWKKKSDQTWLNDNNRTMIGIDWYENPKGDIWYSVWIANPTKFSTLKSGEDIENPMIARVKTKAQALAYAIRYMRSHPNG